MITTKNQLNPHIFYRISSDDTILQRLLYAFIYRGYVFSGNYTTNNFIFKMVAFPRFIWLYIYNNMTILAATTGLLRILSDKEVAGVMAHELAHVQNRDTLIMTITATIAGAISMLANFALFFGGSRNNPLGIVGTILIMILAPLAAMLVQSAISRTREYAADRRGAEICGNPMALATLIRGAGSGHSATGTV